MTFTTNPLLFYHLPLQGSSDICELPRPEPICRPGDDNFVMSNMNTQGTMAAAGGLGLIAIFFGNEKAVSDPAGQERRVSQLRADLYDLRRIRNLQAVKDRELIDKAIAWGGVELDRLDTINFHKARVFHPGNAVATMAFSQEQFDAVAAYARQQFAHPLFLDHYSQYLVLEEKENALKANLPRFEEARKVLKMWVWGLMKSMPKSPLFIPNWKPSPIRKRLSPKVRDPGFPSFPSPNSRTAGIS